MDIKYYNKILRQHFKKSGDDTLKNLKPVLKDELIGFQNYTIVEIDGLQIMFNRSWIQRYREHYTHWGYDHCVEFANIVIRAYCVLNGTPKKDAKDLPFATGVRRMMVVENMLVGIEFRRRTQDLFGNNWGKIDKISGKSPELVYALSCY